MKPEKWYCAVCMKETEPKKAPTTTTISLYKGTRLRKRKMWTCSCKTCGSALLRHDVPEAKIGKDSMCANCGVAIFPAGKTIHECLDELATKDKATFPVRDKILKQFGREVVEDDGASLVAPDTGDSRQIRS